MCKDVDTNYYFSNKPKKFILNRNLIRRGFENLAKQLFTLKINLLCTLKAHGM